MKRNIPGVVTLSFPFIAAENLPQAIDISSISLQVSNAISSRKDLIAGVFGPAAQKSIEFVAHRHAAETGAYCSIALVQVMRTSERKTIKRASGDGDFAKDRSVFDLEWIDVTRIGKLQRQELTRFLLDQLPVGSFNGFEGDAGGILLKFPHLVPKIIDKGEWIRGVVYPARIPVFSENRVFTVATVRKLDGALVGGEVKCWPGTKVIL